MKGYPLDKEVSIPELLRMREEGMSNPEIAGVLDVSPHTIWRYIGPGPRAKNRVRGGTPVAVEIRRAEPAEVQACLSIGASPINLTGAYGKYTIEEERTYICISGEADGHEVNGSIPVDQLSTFIKELQAIERNIGKVQPRLEVW